MQTCEVLYPRGSCSSKGSACERIREAQGSPGCGADLPPGPRALSAETNCEHRRRPAHGEEESESHRFAVKRSDRGPGLTAEESAQNLGVSN